VPGWITAHIVTAAATANSLLRTLIMLPPKESVFRKLKFSPPIPNCYEERGSSKYS
jgi:hypothetical protein